jgi:hypothetical protein
MEILEQTLPPEMQDRLKRFSADDQWSKDVNEKELERNRRERLRIVAERRRTLEEPRPHR